MMNNELIKQLKELKNDSRVGALKQETAEKIENRVFSELDFGNIGANERGVTFKNIAQYFTWGVLGSVARPFSVTAVAFVVLMGSWIVGVNASYSSVPGDTLYSIKIAAERAQLVVATSDQNRARLHVEFAGRRLDEVASLVAASSSVSNKQARARVAMDSFTKEVNAFNEKISTIKNSEIDTAAELVKVVDRKVEEYNAVISQTKDQFAKDDSVETNAASAAVAQAEKVVGEVLVEKHEGAQSEQSATDLQDVFRKDYVSVDARKKLALARLIVISDAISSIIGEVQNKALLQESVRGLRSDITTLDPRMNDSMNFMGIGGFRRAFEIMGEIKNKIAQIENSIVGIEIEISTLQKPPELQALEEKSGVDGATGASAASAGVAGAGADAGTAVAQAEKESEVTKTDGN